LLGQTQRANFLHQVDHHLLATRGTCQQKWDQADGGGETDPGGSHSLLLSSTHDEGTQEDVGQQPGSVNYC
jgi:hypothetical protein